MFEEESKSEHARYILRTDSLAYAKKVGRSKLSLPCFGRWRQKVGSIHHRQLSTETNQNFNTNFETNEKNDVFDSERGVIASQINVLPTNPGHLEGSIIIVD